MAQTKLLNIYWKQNSPFGTFLSGDSIDTYWDSDTDWFYATLNGVATTSGTDIPPYFTYAGENQDYYLARTIYQASICSGTTLYTFQFYPLFPYLFRTQYTNHPTCIIPGPTPTVCDLNFDSLASVTDVTTATATDGVITISASGSNGAVQYRLNSDFVYNDGTAQTSGTFTGLGKGNYLVYARDAINCLAVLSVTVGIQKTYGAKYRLEYYYNDENGANAFHHKTEILEKDYSGAVTEVCGGDSPTILSMGEPSETNKFIPILASALTFTMKAESDGYFQDLYTNDPEKYRIRHSIDSAGGSSYSVMWTGKMLPNQYQEPFVSDPYIVDAVANDGLAQLQDVYFLDDDNNRLTGQLKVISVIAWILRKIGLGINIRSSCNLYATGMATTAADDPLDQAYVDVYRYYLISESPTCWDVLTYILETFTAQIKQYYNVWNIVRPEELIASYDYREYDSNGIYVSNSSYNPVKDLKSINYSSRVIWRDRTQLLKINPGYGRLRLLYNLGLKKNLLLNGDFSVKRFSVYQANVSGDLSLIHGTIPDLAGFQLVNNGTTVTTGIDDLGGGNVAIEITCTELGAYLQSDPIDLKVGNKESIRLTFTFKIYTYKVPTFFYTKVKIEVTYGNYFLGGGGDWTSTQGYITAYVKQDEYNKYQTLEIIAEGPDPTYITGEDFSVKILGAYPIDYDYDSYVSLRALTTSSLPSGFRNELYINPYLYYYELENTTAAESTPDIVRPDDYDSVANPYQWVLKYQSPGNPTDAYSILSIDKIQVEVLSNNKGLPEVANFERSMENENTLTLDKIIFHGSIIKNGSTAYRVGKEPFVLATAFFGFDINNIPKKYIDSLLGYINFESNSADLSYSGYLRDTNGVGYTTWTRDAVPGDLPLETIYQDVLTAQYNKPWRSIHGPFTGDILFTPLDVINEQTDPLGARIYYPGFLEIDFRRNSYNAQFLELTDVTNSEGETGAAFTIGFSLGYKS